MDPERSAAFAVEAFGDDKLILHPGVRKIVIGDLRDLLEELEVVPLIVGPECDRGFERRAAGKIAGDLRHEDRCIVRKLEAAAGPFPHAIQRR